MSFIKNRIAEHASGNPTALAEPNSVASECSDCNKAVPGVGLEKQGPTTKEDKQDTVAMVGPLGEAFTQALNKQYAKKQSGDHLAVAAESMANHVAMLRRSAQDSKDAITVPGSIISSSVGKSENKAPKETLISPVDILSQISLSPELVDFVFVESIDPQLPPGSNGVRTSTHYQATNPSESVAIESFTILVNYKKV